MRSSYNYRKKFKEHTAALLKHQFICIALIAAELDGIDVLTYFFFSDGFQPFNAAPLPHPPPKISNFTALPSLGHVLYLNIKCTLSGWVNVHNSRPYTKRGGGGGGGGSHPVASLLARPAARPSIARHPRQHGRASSGPPPVQPPATGSRPPTHHHPAKASRNRLALLALKW